MCPKNSRDSHENGILNLTQHLTSSPYHQNANDKAGSALKMAKETKEKNATRQAAQKVTSNEDEKSMRGNKLSSI